MKYLNNLKLPFLMIVTLFFFMAQGMAQDNKLDKAENKFCNSGANLVTAIENLEAAYENDAMDEKEFDKVYNKTVKAWNKFVKSADKLENVEVSESTKAYNDLVDEINKSDGTTKTNQSSDKINKNIDKTMSKVDDILGGICD